MLNLTEDSLLAIFMSSLISNYSCLEFSGLAAAARLASSKPGAFDCSFIFSSLFSSSSLAEASSASALNF
jgi:hypothetical protein